MERTAARLFGKNYKTGLWIKQIVKLAAHFHINLKKVYQFNEDDVGILVVQFPGSSHAVVLFHGVIFDPQDGLIWLPDVLAATAAKVQYGPLLKPVPPLPGEALRRKPRRMTRRKRVP